MSHLGIGNNPNKTKVKKNIQEYSRFKFKDMAIDHRLKYLIIWDMHGWNSSHHAVKISRILETQFCVCWWHVHRYSGKHVIELFNHHWMNARGVFTPTKMAPAYLNPEHNIELDLVVLVCLSFDWQKCHSAVHGYPADHYYNSDFFTNIANRIFDIIPTLIFIFK